MTSIRYQLASPDALAQLLPLVKAYHAYEGFAPRSDHVLSQAVIKLLQEPHLGSLWMVFMENTAEPIGYIAICFGYSIEFGGRDGFVDEFFLLEPYRKQGIGKQTLQMACQEARRADVKALHLEVGRSNTSALALYEAVGFRPRGKFSLMSCDLS